MRRCVSILRREDLRVGSLLLVFASTNNKTMRFVNIPRDFYVVAREFLRLPMTAETLPAVFFPLKHSRKSSCCDEAIADVGKFSFSLSSARV